jgi:flagellar capping protein FliD
LNTAHGGTSGTFSVNGSNLHFTYNDTNAGNIGNGQDTGLTYIPNPGSISLTATASHHVHLTTVTEDSHTAGDTVAALGDILMSLESGVFKITSGDAIGVQIRASGNQSASIYIGKSLAQSVTDFADGILGTNGDIDEKVSRYNLDIDKFNEQLSTLETRMKNERQRYVEQFTAMETAVSSFKETSSILDNLMESWKAGLS